MNKNDVTSKYYYFLSWIKSKQNSFYLILLLVSISILYLAAKSSPFSMIQSWSKAEAGKLAAIFFLINIFFYIFKKLQVKNSQIVLAATLVLLSQFNIQAVLAVIIIAFAMMGVGQKIISFLALGHTYGIEYGLIIGYALLVGISQVLMHFPVNTAQFYSILMVILLFTAHKEIGAYTYKIKLLLQDKFVMSWMEFVPLMFALCSISVFIAYPETHSDALIANLKMAHQVEVNKEWAFATELYAWAAWPKGAGWLATIHYLLSGEMAARLFNWFSIILTAFLVYGEANRLGYVKNINLALAMFVAAPVTVWCSFVLFDDGLFTLFVTASIVSAIRSSRDLNPADIFITILFCSASIATKITGVMLVPVIFIIYLHGIYHAGIKNSSIKISKDAHKYIFAMSPILIGLFPYLYMYHSTGNPIFPLYNDIFKSDNYPLERFQDLRWNSSIELDFVYDLVANTSSFMEGGNWTFGLQYAVFLLPVMMFVYLNRKSKSVIQYFLAIVIFSILVFSQMRYARYLYPVLPLSTLLIAGVINQMSVNNRKFILVTVTILCVVGNFVGVKSLNMFYTFDIKNWSVSENRTYAAYYEKELNSYLNLQYKNKSIVLYLHRPYSANLDGVALINHWASPNIKNYVDRAKNLSDVIGFLNKYKVTHVILDEDIANSNSSIFSDVVKQFSSLEKQVGSSQLWKVDNKILVGRKKIEFNDSMPTSILHKGWRLPEKWGVWSYGDAGSISVIAYDRSESSGVKFVFRVLPYHPVQRIDPLCVSIYAKENNVGYKCFKNEQSIQELVVLVPSDLVDDDNLINLDFRFAKPFDGSNLQLGFVDLFLDYY